MNSDPRRPDKVQCYVPKSNNGTGQDLTPDYMNVLGGQQQTAAASSAEDKRPSGPEPVAVAAESNLPEVLQQEVRAATAPVSAEANVIPTSPQYGVAIIASTPADIPTDTTTATTMAVAPSNPAEMLLTDSSAAAAVAAKPPDENKDLHATPSRNDRFKVVKIASLEPFKRGRWKCMDYVDEAPPAGTVRVPQSSGSIQIPGGAFMQQTQSLPQQQIQQMLLQGGFVANGAQFFQPQLLPQGQYYYPQQGATNQTMPQQQVGSSMAAAQFMANQPYFPNAAGFTVPQSFPNMQYVPANLLQQNQNSAFVPTSQITATNFQQSQTYAGQTQPLVNGHNFTPQNEQQSSLPTQSVKNVILNTQTGQLQQQPNITPAQIPMQQQNNQSVQPVVQQFQQQNPAYPPSNSSGQAGQNVVQAQPQQQQPQQQQQQQQQHQPVIQTPAVQSQQNFDASNMYTNPQFAVSVNSLTVLDNGGDNATNEVTESNSADATSENVDDPAKTNPVVNAIDNKIEQAMDLVKSHLMYTVREEVEVLKEKIAELMERIQQLETENNFLRSQIPKTTQGVPVVPSSTVSQAPSPNFIPSSNSQPNASHNPIPNAPQGHPVPAGDALNATQM